MRIGDYADANSTEIKVATSLYTLSYYNGHKGGDYIFQFKPAGCPCSLGDEETGPPVWRGLHDTGFESMLSGASSGLPGTFTYRGQVPRPMREYLRRMEVVVPAVVASLADMGDFTEHARQGASTTAPKQLVAEWARGKLRSNARVLEFAQLLRRIVASGLPLVVGHMAPLIEALEEATGWTLSQMADAADRDTERIATRLLLEERVTDCMFVFQRRPDEKIGVSSWTGGCCSEPG